MPLAPAFQAIFHRLGRSASLPALLLTVGTLVLALAAAVVGWDVAAVVLVLVSSASELRFERWSPELALLTRRASFAAPLRFALRAIVLLVALDPFDSAAAVRAFGVVAVWHLAMLCARALHSEYRRVGPLRPMSTRNMAGSPTIAPQPPDRPVEVTVAQLLTLLPAGVGAPWWVVLLVGLVVTIWPAVVTAIDFRASWAMRQRKRATGFTPPLRQVQAWLDEVRPEVLVHLSGPPTAAYQINTWLQTLESLEQRVLVVIRDQGLFNQMAPTTLPTLALANGPELMMLDLSSVRVALFPTNTGNNIHVLRLPTMMTAFIGHGDSDKTASANPYSRVYDELWVAGEAGADRWRRSGLGIHEDQYRFVGRPQVHGVLPTPRVGEDPVPTLLYAPTWEGVNLAQEYSSVAAVGEKLVTAALATGTVRVVYKPHPFMGSRDAKYRGVHARLVAAITAAARSTGLDHRVVEGGPLDPWFNEATGAVTDISSVVSDFLASEKPYAVFNHTDLTEAEFRTEFPSTGASTVIGRDGSGIAEFLAVLTQQAPDDRAPERRRLATYLLGPPEHRRREAFQAAITALVERSVRERSGYRSTPVQPLSDTSAPAGDGQDDR